MTYGHVMTLVCFCIASMSLILLNDGSFIPFEIIYPELWDYNTRQGVPTELKHEQCDCVRRLPWVRVAPKKLYLEYSRPIYNDS